MKSGNYQPCGIVSLLTDFGLSDPFVGQMHAVILSHQGDLRPVDLCHHVPPQDVRVGAFWLERSVRYFPRGSVHLAVVDPGVGTERAALVAVAGAHAFVAPDNGLLSGVFVAGARAWAIDTKRLNIRVESRTFHGRDLFAPVAALLASGHPPWEMGDEVEPLRLPVETARLENGGWTGRVLFVDHFGNLITNLEAAGVAGADHVSICRRAVPIRTTYADVQPGELVGLVSSFGTLEIAQRDGNASEALDCGAGTAICVQKTAGP